MMNAECGMRNEKEKPKAVIFSFNSSFIIHHSAFLLSLEGFVQLITDSAHRQHVMRILGVCFELLTQAIDVRVYVALVTLVFGAPDLIEKSVARPGATRLGGQQLKNLKLKRGQLHTLTAARDLVTALVYDEVAHLYAFTLLRHGRIG